MGHVLEVVLSGFVNVLDMSRDGNKGTRDTSSWVFTLRDWLDSGAIY